MFVQHEPKQLSIRPISFCVWEEIIIFFQQAFYDMFFDPGINLTNTALTEMLKRNHARVHMTYVRNIEVLGKNFYFKLALDQ